MPIQCRCPSCEREISLPDGLAGNFARCPACGETFRLPDKPGAPRTTPEGPLDSILAQIDPEKIFANIPLPEAPASDESAAILDQHEDGPLPSDIEAGPRPTEPAAPDAPGAPDAGDKGSGGIAAEEGAGPPVESPAEPEAVLSGQGQDTIAPRTDGASGVPCYFDEDEDGPIPFPETPPAVPYDTEEAPAFGSELPEPAGHESAVGEGLVGGPLGEAAGADEHVMEIGHGAEPAGEEDHLEALAAAARGRRFRRRKSSVFRKLVVLILLGLAGYGGYELYRRLAPPAPLSMAWDQQNKARLRDAMEEIEAREARGLLREALEQAETAWLELQGRTIADPELIAIRERISQARQRLIQSLGSASRPATSPITRPIGPGTTGPATTPTTTASTQPSTREIATTAPTTMPTTGPSTRQIAATRPLTEEEQLRETFRTLLQQATNALAAGEAQAALETLFDANSFFERKLRPRGMLFGCPEHLAVLHGMAIADLLLNKPERAVTLFQPGTPLDRACQSKTASRQLLVTRAIADSHSGIYALRSVVRLSEYIKEHPNELDAELLDVLYTALERADDRMASRSPTLEAGFKLYERLSAQLEQTRPGWRRWGVKWVAQDEYAASNMKLAMANQNHQWTVEKLREQTAAVVEAERALEEARRTRNSQILNAASEHLAAMRRAREKALKALELSKSKLPEPPILSRQDCNRLLLPREVAIASAPAATQGTAVTVASRRIGEAEYNLGGVENGSAQPPAATQSVTIVAPPPAIPVAAPPSRRSFNRTAAGFAVAPDLILTSSAPLASATRVLIEFPDGQQVSGTVQRMDASKGLALLKIAGQSMPYFNLASRSGEGQVVCPCYPEVSLFGARLSNVRGIVGTATLGTLVVNLERHPRLAGSPLLDGTRSIIGMEYADREAPVDKCPLIPVEQLRSFMDKDAPSQVCGNPQDAPVVQVTATFEK